MGEQCAESLHARFKYTEMAYNNMRDRVERLKALLRNQHPPNFSKHQPTRTTTNENKRINRTTLEYSPFNF